MFTKNFHYKVASSQAFFNKKISINNTCFFKPANSNLQYKSFISLSGISKTLKDKLYLAKQYFEYEKPVFLPPIDLVKNVNKMQVVAKEIANMMANLAERIQNVNLELYNLILSYIKVVLTNTEFEQSDIQKAKYYLEVILSDLKKINIAEMPNAEAWKQLLAEAYTYKGMTLRCGTEEHDEAIAYYDQALNLYPNLQLAKDRKEAILVGRGMLPEGQTLVFDTGEVIKGKAWPEYNNIYPKNGVTSRQSAPSLKDQIINNPKEIATTFADMNALINKLNALSQEAKKLLLEWERPSTSLYQQRLALIKRDTAIALKWYKLHDLNFSHYTLDISKKPIPPTCEKKSDRELMEHWQRMRNDINRLLTDLEKINMATMDCQQEWKFIFALAYTYQGWILQVGYKEKSRALALYDKALEILPDFELAQKRKNELVTGQSPWIEGQGLMSEHHEHNAKPKPSI